MEIEIRPEATEAERRAVAAALELARQEGVIEDGAAWWAAGLPGEDDDSEPEPRRP